MIYTKKCFKCGNNVLPGTSTCPGCGSPIRNNTNTRQSYIPKNTNGRTTLYKTNDNMIHTSNSSGIVFAFVFIFIVFFAFSMIYGITDFFSEFEKELVDEEIDYVINQETTENNLIDSVIVNNVEISELGEIVLYIKNTSNELINVDVTLNYLNANHNVLSTRFGSLTLVPQAEQVMVFTASSVVYEKFDYSYKVSLASNLDNAIILDTSLIKTQDTGEKIIATYLNNTDKDLEMVKLCVFYYDNTTLKYVDCGRDYDIAKEQEITIEFDYSSEVIFDNLTFNKYEYHLGEVKTK